MKKIVLLFTLAITTLCINTIEAMNNNDNSETVDDETPRALPRPVQAAVLAPRVEDNAPPAPRKPHQAPLLAGVLMPRRLQ